MSFFIQMPNVYSKSPRWPLLFEERLQEIYHGYTIFRKPRPQFLVHLCQRIILESMLREDWDKRDTEVNPHLFQYRFGPENVLINDTFVFLKVIRMILKF